MTIEKITPKDSHNIRSRILNYAILTELLIVDFIRSYFVKEKDKAAKFNDFILNKESFTFGQKIKVFSKLLEEYKDLKLIDSQGKEFQVSKDKKDFIKKIERIRSIRNIVAHNHPFTKRESGEPYIEYTLHNKTKELILNELFDKEFFKLYCDVSWILHDLIRIVNEKSLKL
jgi:hypothetical protein